MRHAHILVLLVAGFLVQACASSAAREIGSAPGAPESATPAESAPLAPSAELRSLVDAAVAADRERIQALYKDLHAHPELSGQERRTAAVVARELREAGCEVVEGFGGGHGVVGVLANGPGRTILVRADLDGLPVREETGVPWASRATGRAANGEETPTMHACGHDVHMSCLVGAARVLAATRARWSGKVVFVGQPAEEIGVGALQMLEAGLYQRFGVPDCALALHDSATLPAGVLGVIEGWSMANVDSVDIVVRGVGGHGAYPHATKDPVVLAARIVLALQTIVSREMRPIDPAVVTVGSIHGGSKHNVIPDEVRLQATLRSYDESVRQRMIESVRRICRGEALAAGIPEDRLPLVEVAESQHTPATWNDPALVRRVRGVFEQWFGAERVVGIEPEMGGEDFGRFGRTAERVPICLFRLGAVDPAAIAAAAAGGAPLPSLHSSRFAPVLEPTLSTGTTAMSAAVLGLLGTR